MIIDEKVEHIVEKTLSISIAAYNVEEILKNTLDSLVAPEIMDDIEVLIIDDGSKDNTAAIGKEFVDKYPNSFKVISKPNGGYGSTINAAIDAATGQYFKTLDGDDWYDTENLVRFVKDLKNMSADLILTPFTMVYEGTGEKQVISMDRKYQEKNITFEQLPEALYSKIKMHSVTYKTSILKENNIRIGEHCFYTDIEYISFPIVYVNDVNFLDYSIYQYRIGLEGQSVSDEGFRKHYKDHLRVVDRILEFYTINKENGLSKEKATFLFNILKALINTQYGIFFKLDNTEQTKHELIAFDTKLKQTNSMLYESAKGKRVVLLRKLKFKMFGLIKNLS